MKTIFGVPKELLEGEGRVALTPSAVEMLTKSGLSVCVETKAGEAAGFLDEDYVNSGAKIVQSAKELWDNSKIIVKVKAPVKSEFQYFREDLVIFSYFHLAVEEELIKELLKKKVCAIAAEAIQNKNGDLPVLRPMSEVAGKMSIQLGARYLEKNSGTKGILLGGTTGVNPAKVVILGGGTVGASAAQTASALGADVTVLDINLERLSYLSSTIKNGIKTIYSNPATIERELKQADLAVCSVLLPSKRAPKLVSAEVVKQMKKGSVLIDVAIDQGGNVETIDRITTLTNPVFEKYGTIHCAVVNLPAFVPKTASMAYSFAILPYIKALGEKGTFGALKEDEALAMGASTCRGSITNENLAASVNMEHTEISLLIGFKVK